MHLQSNCFDRNHPQCHFAIIQPLSVLFLRSFSWISIVTLFRVHSATAASARWCIQGQLSWNLWQPKRGGWRTLSFLFYLYFNTSRTFWVIDLPKRSEIKCKCLCVSAQIALWPRTLPTVRPECAPATAASQRWRDKTTSSSRSNREPRTWSWCTPTGPQR